MPDPKRDGVTEYVRWARRKMRWDLGPREQSYYEAATRDMKEQLTGSALWAAFSKSYEDIDDRYYGEHDGHPLFQQRKPPAWQTKPFDSLVDKSFRINKLHNKAFPDEPPGGWICPDTWLQRVGDIVRARIVVRYLDGPEYLAGCLREIASKQGATVSWEYRCQEDGYYAVHVNLPFTFDIPNRNWDVQRLQCSCELQITTQLQELVQSLMHRYYERQRLRGDEDVREVPWQWRFRDTEFSASYLGHVLHYLEGMIVDIRQKTEGISD